MSKGRLASKLGIQIISGVFISMICALIVYALLSCAERQFLSERIVDEEYIKRNTQKVVTLFQGYVDDNHISTDDMGMVAQWVRDKRNVIMTIYDGNRIIYDSTIAGWVPRKGDDTVNERPNYKTLYGIHFADKDAEVEIYCFFEYRFFVVMNYIKLAVCFICFVLILLLLIQRKTKYIETLEGEIKILEGGDLDYEITVKGNDEITSLAYSINDMRRSLIERQKEEADAVNANHKLVTTMSHDLRTPLTVLIGLLEIIDGKKYNGKEQLECYIRKSRDKAYQIKELSDKIFEYFLAFNIKSEELQIESYSCNVINEMIEDYMFTLEEKGYNVSYDRLAGDMKLYMDINYIHRVFDNIFSNIMKYADTDKEININNSVSKNSVMINIHNYIMPFKDNIESTNIGLETCKNIMELHGGEFESYLEGDIFTACVKFKAE